jgi:hypothetical protein
MSARTTHVTSLVIFVAASFFIGLVAGINIGRGSAGPAKVCAENGEKPVEEGLPKASEFILEDFKSGDTYSLKDFADSNLVLYVSTTA